MPPTAQALADLLRSAAQADPSNLVTLSDEALGTSGLDDLVRNCLRRDELKLVIRPPAIPANPPADGFEVAATVPAGDDGFLALTGCAATLRLLVGSGVDVVLTVPTTSNSKSWVFSDSFPELAHLPYDELPLSGQTLVLSTLVTPPKGVEPKGLTFSGELALTGFFQAAAGLLGISDHYHLTGQISGAGDSLAFDLHADFGIDPKSIGDEIKVTLEHPGAGVDLVPVKSGDTTDQLIDIYLGMQVSVGRAGGATVGVDARIGLPLTDLGSPDHPGLPVDLMLSLSPEPDHQITLASLGALIAGQNWDSFFAGPASVIKDLFETVGFKGYTAIISLNPVAIDSMTLYVGTLKGWDMWTDGPTLSFDVFWTLTFLPGRTLDSDVLVIADLSYPPHPPHGAPPLTFELTIDSDLDITGEEKGTLPALKLSDLNTTVFEGHLVIPEDLVEIQFGDFTFAASLGGGQPKTVSIGAVVSGSFRLFGTSILGVNDMAIEVSFEAAETKTYTATLQGEVFLGPIAFQADATISDKEGTDTVFSLHLVNETVGSMLGHFVHLIDPTFDLSLPEPWSKFLDISLDAFVLEVNVSKGSVALTYDPPGGVDLGFLTIDTVALAYAKATKNQASSTKVEVSGKFLGVPFGTGGPNGNAPLAWDPVNESPPAVPGKGSSLFDLEYLGLGQHIALGGAAPQTMDDVMKRLRATATPAQPGALPPFGTDLVFAAQSHWLIGAQFTVAGTVSITAIFNDPDLYGAVLELSGAKAEIFAGLRLEILYRKVNDVIGVYHIELKLPDAMRHLELGEVSVILPIVDLDIYTNGNFRVDFGFPKGTDFSRSFSFQLFPFVGYGGFYFALLDGATSSRVPAITNGTFAPVVEFGLALQVGVGKTISEGALSGGITVTVLGIVEGVFAWFHPTDTSPAETYHWVKGTIAVTGRLYATIDFAVIQASIDVTANVTATLVIESHQPIYIAVSASVSVLVSVKVVFITIHLTFQASVDASFTIGSASPTPWHVASGGPHSDGQRRMLTGQRTLHTPAELIHPGLARARRRALAARQAGFAITDWPAVCVLPGGRQVLAVQPLPGFTKAHTVQSPTSDIVLLLTARTSAPPNAATFAEHRRLAGPDPATAPFNVLMQAMLGWGIYVMTGRAIADPGVVTASQLEELRHQLTLPQTVAALSSYDTLTAFLAANFTIDIQAAADKTPASVALFPMIPALSLSDLDDQIVDFATQAMVDDSYARKIRAYFDLLQQPFETASGDSPAPPVAAGDTQESIATLLFCQYFAMLLSAAVKAAADYLAAVPYASTGPMSITDVGTAIGDTGLPREPLRVVTPNQDDVTVLRAGALIALPDVVRQVRAGDSFTSIAAALATAGAGVTEEAGRDAAAGWRAYQASDLLTANRDAAVLSAGVPLPLAGLPQVTADGDTVSLIATRVLVRAGGNALLTSLPGLGQQVSELLASLGIDDPGRVLAPGTRVNLADGTRCPSVAGDTVTLLAAYGLARVTGQIDLAGYTAALCAVPANSWLPADPAAPVPAGRTVLLAPLSYQITLGYTIASLASTLMTTEQAIGSAITSLEGARTQVLAPGAVLRAPLTYQVRSGDSLSSIAASFDVTLAYLAGRAATTAGLFAASAHLVIADVPAIAPAALLSGLLSSGAWNNAAGQVSRFLLSGIQLPDPGDQVFQSLTEQQLHDPANIPGITTTAIFALSGQQYSGAKAVVYGENYAFGLTKNGTVPWLTLGGSGSDPLWFMLTADQYALLMNIGGTDLDPQIEQVARLPLFQLAPARIAVQAHLSWQAARLPTGFASGQAAGNPSVWVFPDALVTELEQAAAPSPHQLVIARHIRAGQPAVMTEPSCYAWATVVNLTISLPSAGNTTPSIAGTYVVDGADDTGADLLWRLQAQLAKNGGGAELYLLYPPDPASPNASGLASDALDPDHTLLLKTNLSTLTHSQPARPADQADQAAPPGTQELYAARLSDAAGFLGLLWEASITRSGGFYLRYTKADGSAGLPPTVFGTASSAQLALIVMLKPQPAGLPCYCNCAVVGDTIDPAASLFVQPATVTVGVTDTLRTIADAVTKRLGTAVSAGDLAALNASVPLLLQQGAQLRTPQGDHLIAYGDTFDSIAQAITGPSRPTAADLGTANADAAILTPGAQLQLAAGTLRSKAIVPAGLTGFQVTRLNPDPGQVVGSLFNLIGWHVNGGGTFDPSGVGLATSPAVQSLSTADGLAQLSPDDGDSSTWRYEQTFAVAPFGKPAQPAVSPALPPAAGNPYNGIARTGDQLSDVTIEFTMRDVYGNDWPVPDDDQFLAIPVGYFDKLTGLARWPSLAIAYRIAGPPATVEIDLSMHQDRYLPSASVPVQSALKAVAADLLSYRSIWYQVIQPDVGFSLCTTLAQGPSGDPVSYPVDKAPLLTFAAGAYVYLSALATLTPVQEHVPEGGMTVAGLAAKYGVTPAQIFTGNGAQRYGALFGAARLDVPQVYSVVAGDSLSSIIAKAAHGLRPADLATLNEDVPLNPGTDLVAGQRTVAPKPVRGDGPASLAEAAAAAHAAAPAIAVANATTPGILVPGAVLALGTASYTVTAGACLQDAATALHGTVAQVAAANDAVPLLPAGATLTVADVLVAPGDTLRSLAALPGVGDVTTLASANDKLAGLFAATTTLVTGTEANPPAADPDAALEAYAADLGVPLERLAEANTGAGFCPGAIIDVPGALANLSDAQHCTYAAPPGATAATIAQLFGTTPDVIGALNPAPPGPGGLWICPPMRADAHGHNEAGTLAGLAAAYNADVAALATANAATLGVLAPGVAVTVSGTTCTTVAAETFSSLVNRFAWLGVSTTLAEVVTSCKDLPGLLLPGARVVPVPPPARPGPIASKPAWTIAIEPAWTTAVFPISVSLTQSRDPALVDPDFSDAKDVRTCTLSLPPDPGNGAAVLPRGDDPPEPPASTALSLAGFAALLEQAVPGLHVATGSPPAQDDPATASTIWAVSLADAGQPGIAQATGPAIGYSFDAAKASYFALPPLSSSLMSGDVAVSPYVTGQQPPFSGQAQPVSFRSVDLDRWLEEFLAAVDLFLSPASAMPAYSLSPESATGVLEAKRQLAATLSGRMLTVLEPAAGVASAAAEAMRQAMLTRLSAAYTVDAIVQVPVTVTGPYSDPSIAPRLSGSAARPKGKPAVRAEGAPAGDATADRGPRAYSLSTAKVALAAGESNATFLFSVKAAPDNREVSLDADYVVTELELPEPAESMDGYQGSRWLKFVRPASLPRCGMSGLVVPVPLRAYPGPVTLISQQASQSVRDPGKAADLRRWDLSFVYTHDDAEQDTPIVEVALNTAPGGGPRFSPDADPATGDAFTALAQFAAAWPTLKNDLAMLTALPPGTTSGDSKAAVDAFAYLAAKVAAAFSPTAHRAAVTPPPRVLGYRLQKEQEGSPATLRSLVITDASQSQARPAAGQRLAGPPAPLWPSSVAVTYDNRESSLTPDPDHTGPDQAVFGYPPGIPANAKLAHRFTFTWPSDPPAPAAPAPEEPSLDLLGATLVCPQTFEFAGLDVLHLRSARAGVSIWRNIELVEGATTNPAFVYRTPVASFASDAIPVIAGTDPIDIGAGAPTGIAAALGAFLEALTQSDDWSEDDTLTMQLTAGYSYAIARTNNRSLGPVVPILLIASFDFHPSLSVKDSDPANPNSFVSQVQAVACDWIARNEPADGDAAICFRLAVYAGDEHVMALIRDVTLNYALSPRR